MVFEIKATTERFKIPNIEAGPHVFFGEFAVGEPYEDGSLIMQAMS